MENLSSQANAVKASASAKPPTVDMHEPLFVPPNSLLPLSESTINHLAWMKTNNYTMSSSSSQSSFSPSPASHAFIPLSPQLSSRFASLSPPSPPPGFEHQHTGPWQDFQNLLFQDPVPSVNYGKVPNSVQELFGTEAADFFHANPPNYDMLGPHHTFDLSPSERRRMSYTSKFGPFSDDDNGEEMGKEYSRGIGAVPRMRDADTRSNNGGGDLRYVADTVHLQGPQQCAVNKVAQQIRERHQPPLNKPPMPSQNTLEQMSTTDSIQLLDSRVDYLLQMCHEADSYKHYISREIKKLAHMMQLQHVKLIQEQQFASDPKPTPTAASRQIPGTKFTVPVAPPPQFGHEDMFSSQFGQTAATTPSSASPACKPLAVFCASPPSKPLASPSASPPSKPLASPSASLPSKPLAAPTPSTSQTLTPPPTVKPILQQPTATPTLQQPTATPSSTNAWHNKPHSHVVQPRQQQQQRKHSSCISPAAAELVLSFVPSDRLFFDDANTNPDTLVVGNPNVPFAGIIDRKHNLAWVANRTFQGPSLLRQSEYGVVPIMTNWTKSDLGLPKVLRYPIDPSPHVVDIMDWRAEIRYVKRESSTPRKGEKMPTYTPRSPQFPSTKHELEKLGGYVLCQIGFSTGRQGIFQAPATSKSGMLLKDMIGQYVVIAQDLGMDIGLLRAIEPLPVDEPMQDGSEDVAYAPITRLAYKSEIAQLPQKAKDEAIALVYTRDVLANKFPDLAKRMTVDHCEFQFDRNKLIPYVTMEGFEDFVACVQVFYKAVEDDLKYHCRVFCQRDVKSKCRDANFKRKHLLPRHLQKKKVYNS